jgi:hypothetical protein
VVSAIRMWRGRRSHGRRGLDVRLLATGLGSVVLAQGFVLLVRLAGGFGTHPPTMQFTRLGDLAGHLRITVVALAIDFGAYLPERQGAAAVAVGVLHIAGILAVLAATGTVLYGLIRRGDRFSGDRAAGDRVLGDRVNEVLALSILANLVAFVLSTQPVDRLSAREVVAVLPLGAVLAGRVYGERLRALPARVLGAALALVLAVTFAVQVAAPPVPMRDQVAEWLDARGLRYGLGGYWLAGSTTLLSRGRVTVVPVSGEQHILSYRWESNVDWYDPARHDARFLVLDTRDPTYGTVAAAIAQLGAPVTRHDIGPYAVLVYEHNLLIGLPAQCDGRIAPSMAACVRR